MTAAGAGTGHEVHPIRQEEDLVASRRVAVVAVIGVVVGAASVLVAGLLQAATVGALRPDLAGPRGPLPAPREIGSAEQTPIRDSRTGIDLQAERARALGGWGWLDRDAGLATIPIDQAIDIVVREAR